MKHCSVTALGNTASASTEYRICFIQMPYQRINEIVNGKRGITPSTALRLAKFFGMTPDFWMNLQLRCDLYWAQQAEQNILANIHPRSAVPSASAQ